MSDLPDDSRAGLFGPNAILRMIVKEIIFNFIGAFMAR